MKTALFFFAVLALATFVNAQNIVVSPSELKIPNERAMPELTRESAYNSMKLEYTPASGLILHDEFEFCKPYSRALQNRLTSENGDFTAFIEMYFTAIPGISVADYNSIDSIVSAHDRYHGSFMNMIVGSAENNFQTRIPASQRNAMHIDIMKRHLADIAKKNKRNADFSMEDIRENVIYLPDNQAKEKFNADTLICYSLPVKAVNGDKKFGRKYSDCEVTIIQKKDVGPVIFYSFFTPESYKNRAAYFEKLEQSFSFRQKNKIDKKGK